MAGHLIRTCLTLCLVLLLRSPMRCGAIVQNLGKDAPVVRDLSSISGDSFGRSGLSHLTIAGALQHGMKEVEVWLQTFAPGSGTPVHRHDCEEVFVILKGRGTLYLAPASDDEYPGQPNEFSIHANSTFTVPVNEVHQIRNTYPKEDLQLLAIISRPPIKVFSYKNWYTPHGEAILDFPYPWDAAILNSPAGQCGAPGQDGTVGGFEIR